MSARPYAEKRFAEVNGVRMAYLDEGEGQAIVFQHGNPASSSLWRNVMPHLAGPSRLIACDLVGMGDSGKLTPSGPDRYSYQEQRDHLFALWEHLDLGEDGRPTLSWPRHLPFDGEAAEVVRIVEEYGRWLATSLVPKLFVNADPGALLIGRQREFCRTWPNQTEITVAGSHFVQEDSPDPIGTAVADFVPRIKS